METALLVLNLFLIFWFFGRVFLSTPTPQECSFWPDSTYYKGYCYHVMSNTMTWQEAKDACTASSPSRRLAEMKTEMEAQAVINHAILKDNGAFKAFASIWIGGHYDKNRNVPEWISTKEAITTLPDYRWKSKGKVPPDGDECLSLAGDMRHLSFQSCSIKTISICEEYVGNPCTVFNETSRYINGTCFSLIQEEKVWESAKGFCETNNMKLAEPTMSQMDFITEHVLRQIVYQIVAVPQGISASLKSYGAISKGLALMTRSCGDVTITLYECVSVYRDTMGVFILKINSDNTQTAQECRKSTRTNKLSACSTLRPSLMQSDGRKVTDDACKRWMFFYREPSLRTGLGLFEKVTPRKYGCRTMYHDRVTATMSDDYPGVMARKLKGSYGEAWVGARRDWAKGGKFQWETSGTLVDLPQRYWFKYKPSSSRSKNHLMIAYLTNQLADHDGANKRFSSVCQKDLQLFSHVMVVPGDQRDHDLQITTSSIETVMIHGALLDKSGSQIPVDELRTAVTKEHPRTLDIGKVLSSYDSETPERLLLLQSTKEITVITYSHTSTESLFGQIVYPTEVHSSKYIIYPSNGEVKSFKILIVAIQEGETLVKVISEKETVEHVLQRYERRSSISPVVDAGMLVVADKKVAVYTLVELEGYSGPVVFPQQPLDALTGSCITIPSLPIDPTSKKADHYLVVAAYANTTLESNYRHINGLSVLNEGDLATLTIPTNGFDEINADKIFYLWKTETTGSCTMPMIPSSMWKTNYNFVVSMGLASRSSAIYVVAVYANNAKDSLLLNDKPLTDQHCESIRKTGDFKACYFKVNQGSYDLRLTSGDTEFMAYLYGTQSGQSFCHPLGVKGPKDVKDIAYKWETYRKNLMKPLRFSSDTAIPMQKTNWRKLHHNSKYIFEDNADVMHTKNIASNVVCLITCEMAQGYNLINYSKTRQQCTCLKKDHSIQSQDIEKTEEWDIWYKK